MQFIDKNQLNEYTDFILNFPAFQDMDEISGENFKDIMQGYFKNLYVDKIKDVKDYLQFNINTNTTNQLLKDYGIDSNYINDLNPSFKNALIYFLERLFQKKGSIEVLQIFNKIFESLFSSINFYRIIIVKNSHTTTDSDGIKHVDYFLTYALEPLYINDKNRVIKFLDSKVSLTGKFLMDLTQYKNFKIFPANTNLVYMQFTSTEINLDNLKFFSTGVKAYALTVLKGETIPFRNFYNQYFDVESSDLAHIIFFIETYRKRLINSDFDFNLLKDKKYLSLIMDKDNIFELESFLHEYKNLNFHDRKVMNDFKRRWGIFTRNYFTTNRIYHNYKELKAFINDNYPEIITIISDFETDKDYLQFYIDMYLNVLANIDIEDNYINLYINSLFLTVITGDAFIDNFFTPIYKIFQKYFFPIEMDFLAKIAQTFLVKDKFEGISYDQKISMSFDSKEMTKIFAKPDKIRVYILKDYKKQIYLNDKINVIVNTFQRDNIIKKDNIYLNINTDQRDNLNYGNHIYTTTNANQRDNLNYGNHIYTLTDVSNVSKQKLNNKKSLLIDTKNDDNLSYNEKNQNEIDRYNYTSLYDDLKTYLIFENLQVDTKLRNLTNTEFKYDREDDQIYFSIHSIF